MHLVMFDIDGTLVDSDGFDGALFAETVADLLGLAVDRTWASYRHVTDSGILEELLADERFEHDRKTLRARVRAAFVERTRGYVAERGGITPIRGAPEFVARLRETRGVTVAIATGGWRETAELKLRHVGIDPEGLAFATSSDALSRVDIMRAAERQAEPRGPFARRTYFGDGDWDKQASAVLGYDFVAVGDRVEHAVAFADFSEPLAILEALAR